MGGDKTLWTAGHSTLTLEKFLDLVRGAELLADIRSYPGSRRFPHFNRESLQALPPYRWMPDLGGRRRDPGDRHPAWRVAAFASYAAYMETEKFRQALSLLEREAQARRTTIFCSEALWWRCHRRLVSDALVARGWRVLHLPGETPHVLSPMARIDRDGTLIYDREEASQ